MNEKIEIGGFVLMVGSVAEIVDDGYIIEYRRNGEIVREHMTADDFAYQGFDDGDGI